MERSTEASRKMGLDSKELTVCSAPKIYGWMLFFFGFSSGNVFIISSHCDADYCWQNRLFGQIYRLKDLSDKNAAKNAPQIYR